jgi:hypothetical protein
LWPLVAMIRVLSSGTVRLRRKLRSTSTIQVLYIKCNFRRIRQY